MNNDIKDTDNLADYLKDDVLFNDYILKIIRTDKKDLFEKIIKYFKESNMDFNENILDNILVGLLYFDRNISYFIQNFSIEKLNQILELSYKIAPKMEDYVYELLVNDFDVDSLIEVKIYLQIAYSYLIKQVEMLDKQDNTLEYKQKVENIFVFYIESMKYYLSELYNPVIFQRQNLEILAKTEAMCVIIGETFDNRAQNRVDYIKSLKEALKYNSDFKLIILNSINVIENSVVEDEEVVDSEFDDLAAKVKQTIFVLIRSNKINEAKYVLEEYKKTNPTDPDIEKFVKLMI